MRGNVFAFRFTVESFEIAVSRLAFLDCSSLVPPGVVPEQAIFTTTLGEVSIFLCPRSNAEKSLSLFTTQISFFKRTCIVTLALMGSPKCRPSLILGHLPAAHLQALVAQLPLTTLSQDHLSFDRWW